MKAVILMGGKGIRLRPLTARRSKAVVPLLARPFLATQLDLLRRAGITEAVLCIASVTQRVARSLGDGSDYGISLTYAPERRPLGTGGALGNIRPQLTEPFLCLNGDVLTDLPARELIAAHEAAGAMLTLSLTEVEDASAYGRVATEPAGDPEAPPRVVGFAEKSDEPGPGDINAGFYAMTPEILDLIPEGQPVSLETEVFPQAIASGKPVAAYRHTGYFRDIGSPTRYLEAHRDALDGRISVPGAPPPNPGGVIVDRDASIDPEARLIGPSFIGPGAQVRAGARIGPYAVLGRRVRVEANAQVEHSVLWADVRVSENARVSHSIIGLSGFVGPAAQVEDALLGDKSTVAGFSRLPWQD